MGARSPTNTAVPLKSNYDYHDAFAPFFLYKMEQQHGPRGQPAEYWQNRADYVLTAKLNAQNNEIVGTDIITYTNNSPDTMSFIWMNLDQNLFKSDSRGNAVVPFVVAMVRKEKILTEVIKSNPLKLLVLLKENLLKSMLSL
jgi:hypothetical protein